MNRTYSHSEPTPRGRLESDDERVSAAVAGRKFEASASSTCFRRIILRM